jgi:pimeloyl-ACP methyl ester carboxylesterase
MQSIIPALLLVFLSTTAYCADLAREKRISEQITDAILQGEPLWLEAENRRFLAIHTGAETPKTLGGVILLHGMGAHPDWPEVIHPLRTGLPGLGWETLSIQLPVASGSADAKDYLKLIPEAWPRISAAITYMLQERNNSNLILIGHSLGAHTALEFLVKVPAKEIQALVMIGLPTPPDDRGEPVMEALSKIKLPLFDLYGSRDLDSVLETADRRRQVIMKSGNPAFRQYRMEGADHFFNGLEAPLIKQVNGWLRKVASGDEIMGSGISSP